MDVPASAAGIVRELKVRRGGRVSQGDVIALIEAETATAPAVEVAVDRKTSESGERAEKPRAARHRANPVRTSEEARKGAEGMVVGDPGFSRSHASPVDPALARELGVDLAKVQGTGAKERITEQDVKAHVKHC